MSDEYAVDKRQARRSFERAATTYDAAAVLQNEVCQRMLARIEYIRHAATTLLDAGSGTGNAITPLTERFRDARIIPLDIAPGMLRHGRRRMPWWRRVPGMPTATMPVCGDMERLPIRDGVIDLVWSNLALQWVNELPVCFAEMRRVLAPGGLIMFSTFGPDTLKELRRAYADADRRTHVNRFVDMHDIGDMLVGAGFSDPVMDMEHFTLTYADVRTLMRDLKAIGAHNVTRGRPPGLSGKSRLQQVERTYELHRKEGRLPATFEVIYGHAWKPLPRLGPSGRAVIDIKPAGGKIEAR
jgi:malonyl-CoA O-methyltransferase